MRVECRVWSVASSGFRASNFNFGSFHSLSSLVPEDDNSYVTLLFVRFKNLRDRGPFYIASTRRPIRATQYEFESCKIWNRRTLSAVVRASRAMPAS
jgi:hypothetical protein